MGEKPASHKAVGPAFRQEVSHRKLAGTGILDLALYLLIDPGQVVPTSEPWFSHQQVEQAGL